MNERDLVDRAWRETLEMPIHSTSICSLAELSPGSTSGFKLTFRLPADLTESTAHELTPLADLFREVERSREMLTWDDDWDDEGSPHFEESTWTKAIGLLDRHARLLLKRGIVLPTPRILPGPNASIDLHWETESRELLINVPPDGPLAGFYGEGVGTHSLKGKIDLESSDLGLFTWLTITD